MSDFDDDDDNKEKRPAQAFPNKEYTKMRKAVVEMAWTQLGVHADPYTVEELNALFVPPRYRSSLKDVYDIETDSNAEGEIYIDLMKVLPQQFDVFEDIEAQCKVKTAVLVVSFNRRNTPGAFITPRSLFGSMFDAVGFLRGETFTPELRVKLFDQCSEMIRIAGQWTAVLWTLERLQNSMRTPQQMRYVWPATYTIASAAGLPIAQSLSQPSARAGNNAVVDRECSPFLKATYEVVSNSVLLGIKPDYTKRYREGQVRLNKLDYSLNPRTGDNNWITIDGI